jgi:hypothetical protein
MTTPLDPELAGPAAGDPGVSSGGRRHSRRLLMLITLTVVGLVGIAGGGAGLGLELTRTATPAEQAAAVQQEAATRWQRLPAGGVFPAQLAYGYEFTFGTSRTTATLVGIAPPASCLAALEPTAYRVVRPFGCTTVLRATYVDAAGTAATTVGVAVFRSSVGAQRAQTGLTGLEPADGLHAVAYSGTVAGAFGDPSRGVFGSQVVGPYVFLYTAGFTDGIPGATANADPNELFYLGTGVVTKLVHVLTDHGRPCSMKDIRC